MSISFSGTTCLRNGINKIAGDPVPVGATILNLSGLALTVNGQHDVRTVELSDVWGLFGQSHPDVAQVRRLVDELLALEGIVHLRAVCYAGHNRSRFAASLYGVMFNLHVPHTGFEPVYNLDFRYLLEAARFEAKLPGATAASIGQLVVDRTSKLDVAMPARLTHAEAVGIAHAHMIAVDDVLDEEECRRCLPNPLAHCIDMNLPCMMHACNDMRCCGMAVSTEVEDMDRMQAAAAAVEDEVEDMDRMQAAPAAVEDDNDDDATWPYGDVPPGDGDVVEA